MVDVDITPNMFLNMLYRNVPYGYVEFRLLKNEKPSYPLIRWMEMPNTLSDENLDELTYYNDKGLNIYFGVAARNGKTIRGGGHADSALFTSVLWTDTDTKDRDALKRLRDARPSFIVDSGGGYHGYWLLNKTLVLGGAQVPYHERDLFEAADDVLLKRTLKGLAIALEADPKVAEFARIMRLPGFINTKPGRNGAVCDVIEGNLLRHDFMDIANEYAYLVKEELKIERAVMAVPSEDIPNVVKQYIANGAPVGERNHTLNRMAYILHSKCGKPFSEIDNLLRQRARMDGLDDDEITITLNSACSAAVSPSMNIQRKRMAGRDKMLKV
jgi:hypothetical protein